MLYAYRNIPFPEFIIGNPKKKRIKQMEISIERVREREREREFHDIVIAAVDR